MTDWLCYELVLFNILQNAVKYNRIEGEIVIVMTLTPFKNSFEDRMGTLRGEDTEI